MLFNPFGFMYLLGLGSSLVKGDRPTHHTPTSRAAVEARLSDLRLCIDRDIARETDPVYVDELEQLYASVAEDLRQFTEEQ